MAPPSKRSRGTTMLGGEDHGPAGQKPWWRGAAIVGGAFVLLLALAVGVNLSRGSDGATSTNATPSNPSSSGGGTDSPSAGGDSATTKLRSVDGVPVGYPHSTNGAVQAAVNFEVARSSSRYFTSPTARHQILKVLATTASRATLVRNDDIGMPKVLTALGINSSNSGSLVARAAPLGTKVDSYSPQVATVEVWMTGVVGSTEQGAPLPVSASWATYTLTLQWEGDWRLASVSSVTGPTPLDTGDEPSSSDALHTADEEFHAPPYVG